VSALDPTQDTARRREEREQRKAEKEWEAIGTTAEKRAEFAHAIDLAWGLISIRKMSPG
jgi:hypothetical protein